MKKMNHYLSMGLAVLAVSSSAYATGPSFSYEGRAFDSGGVPLAALTYFKIQVRSPDASACVMYEETRSINLGGSNGYFTLAINDGTGTGVAYGPGISTFSQVFANAGTYSFSSPQCLSAPYSYTPGLSDGRKLLVSVSSDGTTYESLPVIAMGSVPFAIEANQVQGFNASSLLRVQDGTVNGVAPVFTTAMMNELGNIVGGTSAQYAHAGQLNGSAMPGMSPGQVLGWSGSTWTSTDPIANVFPFAKVGLPSCTGGQVLTNSGPSAFTCVTPVPSGAAGGDLTGVYPNPSVGMVGASSAANIHTAELLANGATYLNTASKIVSRDGSGNFSAGTVNLTALSAAGNISAGSIYATVGGFAGGTSANGNVIIDSTTNVTKGFVELAPNGGNVGIGTASPAFRLHVADFSGAPATVEISQGSSSGVAALDFTNDLSTHFSTGVAGSTSSAPFVGDWFISNSAQTRFIAMNPSSGSIGINIPPSASTYAAAIDIKGHEANSSTALTGGNLSLCGSAPSPTILGNDVRGIITLGGGLPSACTLTFNTQYLTSPYCVISPYGTDPGSGSRWFVTSTSPTTMVLGFVAVSTATQKFNYYCIQ
jgi:hypothetical protein